MFVGTYYNSIDSKARLIIPAKFRDELGGRCIIAKSLDKCLTIYTGDEWEKLLAKLEQLPTGNLNARKLKRYFNSSANLCDIDRQGRLTIPQDLREYAGIKRELVTIGSNRTIEVWSKEQWNNELDSETGELMNASDVAESLEQYGF